MAGLGHPCKFQRVSRLGSVTARHPSSRRQPNFAALNRRQGGHHVGHWPTFLVVFGKKATLIPSLTVDTSTGWTRLRTEVQAQLHFARSLPLPLFGIVSEREGGICPGGMCPCPGPRSHLMTSRPACLATYPARVYIASANQYRGARVYTPMVDESMLTSETAEQLAQLDERKISLFVSQLVIIYFLRSLSSTCLSLCPCSHAPSPIWFSPTGSDGKQLTVMLTLTFSPYTASHRNVIIYLQKLLFTCEIYVYMWLTSVRVAREYCIDCIKHLLVLKQWHEKNKRTHLQVAARLQCFYGSPAKQMRALYFCRGFFFLLFSSFFPRPISAVEDWMFTILPHMVWP